MYFFKNIIIFSQSSNYDRAATPLLIQWLYECVWYISKYICITKFVECPEVVSVPRLADVL